MSKLNEPLLNVISEKGLFYEDIPFDEYHLTMAQTDFFDNTHHNSAVKSYFYRVAPFGGSYAIFAGLTALLSKINSFSYKQIAPYLVKNSYNESFIGYVNSRDKLQVKIHSIAENSVVFPSEPIVIFETNIIDSRILEGIVLSELNFATLVTTKWHRIKSSALNRPIMEFGRRRAQNSLKSSLYSYIAGIAITSNCEVSNIFGIPTSGTMGHEFVQTYEDEFTAFDKWLEYNPSKPCLLIDTVNTLQSGLGNAVKAFQKHKSKLIELGFWSKIGVRIDSGDLAYLASKSHSTLSERLGTDNISIVLTNDLDEYSIESILSQLMMANKQNVVDKISFGVGTRGATAWGEPALGGVFKLSEVGDKYILKISNNNAKTTIPANTRSALVLDSKGEYVTTLIHLADEVLADIKVCYHPDDDSKFISLSSLSLIKRHSLVYASSGCDAFFYGDYPDLTLDDIKNRNCSENMLDWSYKRIINPHIAKVSLSPKLFEIRKQMIKQNIYQMKKVK